MLPGLKKNKKIWEAVGFDKIFNELGVGIRDGTEPRIGSVRKILTFSSVRFLGSNFLKVRFSVRIF